MQFFTSAITTLQTLVVALGAGLGVWGVVNLLEVGDAGVLLGLFTRLDEVRDSDGGQDAENRDHDHNLNQSETLAVDFHSLFLWLVTGDTLLFDRHLAGSFCIIN